MIPILVIAALAGGGCLASPPSAGVDGDDAGVSACGELDLFVETFEEDDPEARFRELWDPTTSPSRSSSTLVRLGLGASTPSGTIEWSIDGLNTSIACQ